MSFFSFHRKQTPMNLLTADEIKQVIDTHDGIAPVLIDITHLSYDDYSDIRTFLWKNKSIKKGSDGWNLVQHDQQSNLVFTETLLTWTPWVWVFSL
jgi:hypothetical protein